MRIIVPYFIFTKFDYKVRTADMKDKKFHPLIADQQK